MSEPAQKYRYGDYTVGWICTLPETELVAAVAMLDEQHPVLPGRNADKNVYVLGSIAYHNVVIACLPAGTAGKVSAAVVATHMVRSFPAIKIGINIGIGGGAPYYKPEQEGEAEEDSEDDDEWGGRRDVRLGDVVIGLHSKSSEAVVQYDFGQSLQGKGFVHIGGKLDRPPFRLRSALSVLQQQHVRKGNRIPTLLENAISKNPGMMPKFEYPGSDKDQLFKSDVIHSEEGKASCEACCGLFNMNVVRRRDRNEAGPRIHYGTIGSADQEMKDAKLRDKWAEKERIICFDTGTAAGLMESFPCLIILGICNYADSHDNTIWEPYAAAMAASCAKELMLVIAPQRVMDASPTEQALSKIETMIEMMKSQVAGKDDGKILD